MKKYLEAYLTQHQLFTPTDKILVAVSGGVDSVVLCHLFKKLGVDFSIGHCNFQLRGEASDLDAVFVKGLARELGVPYFGTQFETEKLAKEEATSIQIMARELRYDWLNDIRDTLKFDYIATAHHANDSIETALYNLAKGSGIRGVRGMLPKHDFIIHPMLFADKEMIQDYAKKQKIVFREDASNATDKYVRNRIRHQVIPILKEINPALEKTAKQTFDNLRDVETLYLWAVDGIRNQIMQRNSQEVTLAYPLLNQYPAKETVLYELLRPYGFNTSQVLQLLNGGSTGAQFISNTHRLVVDRKQYIIGPLKENQVDGKSEYLISADQEELHLPKGRLTLHQLEEVPTTIPNFDTVACMDMVKIAFPLKLRRWKAGDQFLPLGMNGQHKKLKDFFGDKKLSILEKERTWILESNGVICWIVGQRMDERFKIDKTTRRVLVIKWEAEVGVV